MKQTDYIVQSNNKIASSVYELKLSGETNFRAGQFVELAVGGFSLRRPFGVADCESGVLTLLYRVQGAGTEAMTKWKSGDMVNALVGLGNGFHTAELPKKPVIIGGGMGIAPLYYLAKTIAAAGVRPSAVLGFKNKAEAFYIDKFINYCDVTVATDDGGIGVKGNVIDALNYNKIECDYYYACGPEIMMRNLQKLPYRGELSLEARMGCGFGACMGCSIHTTSGAKRVCKEGPVFSAAEVIF